jgi:hypothetical protein
MKALLTTLFAALFAFAAVAGYAATSVRAGALYNTDEAKDEAKTPSPTTEQKGDEDKDKDKDKDDKKS